MTREDPMRRAARVRETIIRENAKLRPVDHNGRPIEPPPAEDTTPHLPAANPALGSSASGPPDTAHEMAEARQRGDWKRILELLRDGLSPTDAA